MATSSNEADILLGLSNNLADAVESAGASVVSVHARRRSAASGVVWKPGVVVTADHVIQHEESITVSLAGGRTIPATLAGRDASTDLAVLRIEAGDLPVAQVGGAPVRVGQIVLAVARPSDNGLGASWGAVSAVGGPWRTGAGGKVDSLIRPDLTMYPGFSGGPLVDAGGKIAGINTSGLSRDMVLAIPASTVERVVSQLFERGHISRGYLGIAMQGVSLPDNLVDSLHLSSKRGLILVSIESGGPADRAGLLVGDILLELGGKSVEDGAAVQSSLDPEHVGQPLTIRILRAGESTERTLTVGERPRKGE